MLRHIAVAAFRNLAANKLISAIAILGLAAGIAAALLMALVVKNQLSFDHFIPGHERTYRMFWQIDSATNLCHVEQLVCGVPNLAEPLLARHPAIESVARLSPPQRRKFQQGAVTGWDELSYADETIFAVLPLPVAHGSLQDALSRPGGIVIPVSIARKYFGRGDVVGQSLTLQGRPFLVRAVIRDLPPNATNLATSIFVSQRDGGVIEPATGPFAGKDYFSGRPRSHLYLRVKPDAAFSQADATRVLHETRDYRSISTSYKSSTFVRDAELKRLDRINLWEPLNPGIGLRLGAAALTGALVLLIGAINFVNLMVARASRRAREVAIRKTSGSGRLALMLQFLGEALVTVCIAAVIGVALTEWLLPPVNAFLDTGAALQWNDPLLAPVLLSATLLLALAVGAWPALVLSGFRPALVLRNPAGGSAALARGALVTLQFSILIVLAIAGAVMWLQRDFAAREALRLDSDQMLLLRLPSLPFLNPKERAALQNIPLGLQDRSCPVALVDPLRKLPGVRGAACSDEYFLNGQQALGWQNLAKEDVFIGGYSADPRLFALYGIRPLAGTLPSSGDDAGAVRRSGSIINLAAVRRLGFATPQAAIGRRWTEGVKDMNADFRKNYDADYRPITAVIPDFSFASVQSAIPPAVYTGWDSPSARLVHVKLTGRDIPETLAAIDHIWAQSGIDGPLDRFFLDDHMQQLYRDVTRDAQFFAGTAAIAILLACMGLVGIAVSTAERRTKEIGVRKAMGATTPRIVGLLLWQFSLPVLLANIIAWPLAFWLMQRWLSGFAYRIELSWWFFAAASGVALLLALLTVMGQAIKTARQKPVLALRYE